MRLNQLKKSLDEILKRDKELGNAIISIKLQSEDPTHGVCFFLAEDTIEVISQGNFTVVTLLVDIDKRNSSNDEPK